MLLEDGKKRLKQKYSSWAEIKALDKIVFEMRSGKLIAWFLCLKGRVVLGIQHLLRLETERDSPKHRVELRFSL